MSKALEVWKLLWPRSIPAEDFERALLVAQLSRDPDRGVRRTEASARVASAKPARSDGMMTTAEMAEAVGVTPGCITGWCKEKRLPFKKGKSVRWTPQGFAYLFDPSQVEFAKTLIRRRVK